MAIGADVVGSTKGHVPLRGQWAVQLDWIGAIVDRHSIQFSNTGRILLSAIDDRGAIGADLEVPDTAIRGQKPIQFDGVGAAVDGHYKQLNDARHVLVGSIDHVLAVGADGVAIRSAAVR